MRGITVGGGVVAAEDGGEAFLLDTATRRYFRLNEPGLVIWRALEAGDDPCSALRRRYPRVAEEVAARDVAALVDALVRSGLAERPTSG